MKKKTVLQFVLIIPGKRIPGHVPESLCAPLHGAAAGVRPQPGEATRQAGPPTGRICNSTRRSNYLIFFFKSLCRGPYYSELKLEVSYLEHLLLEYRLNAKHFS